MLLVRLGHCNEYWRIPSHATYTDLGCEQVLGL